MGEVPQDLQANLQRFVDAGVEVAITELDVRVSFGSWFPVISGCLSNARLAYEEMVDDDPCYRRSSCSAPSRLPVRRRRMPRSEEVRWDCECEFFIFMVTILVKPGHTDNVGHHRRVLVDPEHIRGDGFRVVVEW